MPYIGRSTEAFGVRTRYTYTPSAGDTSVSGADVNGLSLSFTDGAYVDVFLNGVKLKSGDDYVTTTANTIGSLSAMQANDEVEVIVYDVFSLADMVSSSSGGDFFGQVNFKTDSAVVAFGADNDTTLTHTDGTGLTLNSTNKLTFGDAASFVQQSSDGVLRIDGEATIDLNASTAVTVSNDLKLDSDSAVLSFGADSEIQLIHVADDGLILKHTGTGDGKEPSLTFQAGDNDIAQDDLLGSIQFQAPDEGATGDSQLVAAAIEAVSEGDFSSTVNATKLNFKTGASETATTKMTLSSGGNLSLGTDSVELAFGNDSDVKLTHVADTGLILAAGGQTTSNFGTPANGMKDFVIGGDGNVGMSILTTANNNVRLAFGDVDDPDEGQLNYDCNNGGLTFVTDGNTNGVKFDTNGNITTQGTNDIIKTDGFLKVSSTFAFHGSTDDYGNVDGQNFHELNSSVGNEFILMTKVTSNGTTQQGIIVDHAGTGNTSNTQSNFISGQNTANKFRIRGNGNFESATNSYGSNSDERLKSEIVDANSQWDDIKAIKFRNYKKWDKPDLKQLGVIAQELETISPGLVEEAPPDKFEIKHNSEFGVLYTSDDEETKPVLYTDSDDIPEGYKVGDTKEGATKVVGDVKEVKSQVKSVKYSVLYMKALKALQEAMTRIETLETKVKALEDA